MEKREIQILYFTLPSTIMKFFSVVCYFTMEKLIAIILVEKVVALCVNKTEKSSFTNPYRNTNGS